MAGYEIEDAQGNRYRISKGAGPDYPHPENIGAGSSLIASGLLQGMPFESLVAANDYFWFDTLCRIPDCPGNPADALANAIASSHLTIEKVGTALAVDDEEPDPRAGLRVKIQQALTQIIAGERAEAAMYQRQMDQENILTKGLIYTGSFMEGIGSSAWGAVVWAKEVSDLINPVVIISNHAKAVQAGWESEDFYATYSSNVAMAQKRELVEALGFDPTSITEQQIDEAIAMTNLVLDDPSLRDMLYRFVKDYVEAQHAVEITNVAGSGAFEIILTIVLAAVTGGAGVIAAVGSKTALIRKFQKVGDLLSEFAKATRRLKLKARERKAKSRPADFKDLETAEAPVKKTDARGAETAETNSKSNNIENLETKARSKPEWLRKLDEGNKFNETQSPNYPHKEIYINKPDGTTSYYRLDSYNPESGEIVSRKYSQIAEIQEKTALTYINEIPKKYPPGAKIADVPSSGSLAGEQLQGQMILEIPVQKSPIPSNIIKHADDSGVIIRDIEGKVY